MARPRKINPARPKKLHIDADVADRVDLLLVSELTGKIPEGAWGGLVTVLLRNWLDSMGHLRQAERALLDGADPSQVASKLCEQLGYPSLALAFSSRGPSNG